VLRAAQFHEFVGQLIEWGTQGEVSFVPRMRTQLVAARAVAEALAKLATDREFAPGAISEVAGPREESLVEMAKLLVARRGDTVTIEPGTDPTEPKGSTSRASCCPARRPRWRARRSRSGSTPSRRRESRTPRRPL
jgi:hypothetical protein